MSEKKKEDEDESKIESIQIRVKMTSGKLVLLTVDSDLTIEDLKAILSTNESVNTEPSHQTLVFKGRVCQDDLTLNDIGMRPPKADLILIKKSKRARKSKTDSPSSTSSSSSSTTTTGTTTGTASTTNPMTGMAGLFSNPAMASLMGGMDMSAMQEQLMQNPDAMRSLMESPMIKQMMGNTDFLQNMFNSNPALQKMLDDNPQMRHVLKDPKLLESAMKAASNPDYYNEMLKSNDKALANIESLPGGFSALSRMYKQISNPMDRAMDDMYRRRFGTNETVISEVDKEKGPTSESMPNPFSSQYKTEKRQRDMQKRLAKMNGGRTKMASPFGGANPFGSGMAGMGMPMGMGGAGGGAAPGMNPWQQMMGASASQASAGGAHAFPNWMNNAFMQPRQPTQTQRQIPVIPSVPSTSSTSTPTSASVPSPPVDSRPPEEKYSSQMEQLIGMGFTDRSLVIEALVKSDGDLVQSIDYIDAQMDARETNGDPASSSSSSTSTDKDGKGTE